MADAEGQAVSDAIREQAAASREDKDQTQDKDKDDVGKQPDAKPDDIEQIAAQADKPDAVKRAIQAERENARKERDRAEELAAKVKEFEDRDKSEQEKLEERAASAESRASAAEAKLLRFQIAVDKSLPLDLAERLQGKSKKELEEDADRLLDLLKPNGKPSGDPDAGRGEGGEGESFNDVLRKRAGV